MKANEYRNAVNAGKIPAPIVYFDTRQRLAKFVGKSFTSAGEYRAWVNASNDTIAHWILDNRVQVRDVERSILEVA